MNLQARLMILYAWCAALAVCGTAAAGDGDVREALRMKEGSRVAVVSDDRKSVYTNYDVHHYDIDIRFNVGEGSITGAVTMSATSRQDGLTEIEVDLYNNMTVDSVSGDAVGFNRTSNRIAITMSSMVDSGEAFSVKTYYHGEPSGVGLQGLAFERHSGSPIISSLSAPYLSRSWWACKDTPSDKADSVDVRMTHPANLVGVSNGTLVSEVDNDDGTRTTHWKTRYPIATYLVFVSITNYRYRDSEFVSAEDETLSVPLWAYPESWTQAVEMQDEVVGMLGVLSELFGGYPYPGEKYGMAEFSWGGGMEHQTCSSIGSSAWTREIVVHELAHQWWGDMVTPANFQHTWLSEGFATYSEALYFEQIEGRERLHEYMNMMTTNFGTETIFGEDTTDIWGQVYPRVVYDKGAWVLHMLRHIVWDDRFFEVLAEYRRRYEYRSALTEDFRRVAEDISEMELGWFFDRWIYGEGRPSYDWLWEGESAGDSSLIRVSVWQSQSEEPFMMPIDLQLTGDVLDTTVVLWDSLAYQKFTVTVPGEVTGVGFDPENWVLKYAREVKPPVVVSTIPADGAQNIPTSLPLIRMTFDRGLESFTIDSGSVRVEGKGGLVPGRITHVEGSERIDYVLERDLLHGETIRVRLSGSIESTFGLGLDGNGNGVAEGTPADDYLFSFVASPAANVVEESNGVPEKFFLAQNTPNPFNPTTSISFGLSKPADVRLEVFDILGRPVEVLYEGGMDAGYKRVEWSAVGRSSGVYLVRLCAGDFEDVRKMVLLK